MKKVMFVLVALLLVSTFAFALESGPSNKVGYVKIQCNAGAVNVGVATPFGLPFKFWTVPTGNVPTYGTESRKPSSIIGTQTNCASSLNTDRIMRQDNSMVAYRATPSCNWVGSLETDAAGMQPGRCYWYINKSGAVRQLVLAGEADTTGLGINFTTVTAPTVAGQSVATPYSWRDPRDRDRSVLNLRTQGFTGGTSLNSDRVLIQGPSGLAFYYLNSTSAWGGTLTGVTPGGAYWIINKHVGNTWNYTYNASGAGLIMPGGDVQLQKISAPATKTAAGTTTTAN